MESKSNQTLLGRVTGARTCIIAPTNRVILLGMSLNGGNTFKEKQKVIGGAWKIPQ